MKMCVQCGRMLEDEKYEVYVSRSTGQRKSSVGRHTVCKDCESVNRRVDRIWKKADKTEEDFELLAKVESIFKGLLSRGLQPKGAYARHVVDTPPSHPRSNSLSSDLDNLFNVEETEEFKEFIRLLKKIVRIDLVEEPDYYYDLLAPGRAQYCKPAIDPRYADLYAAAMRRLDEYEEGLA